MHHGFVGAVVEGAARDLPELRDLGFPVFARAVTPHDRWGLVQTVSCQEPVIIGGVVVRPGDVLVGDDDGLVVVPAHALAEVVARAEQMAAAERAILEKCRAGVPYVEALRSGPQWWREGHEAKE
jgi:4-hydroxy-4-methyl-2-oxoglutarate aldolase